MKTEGPEAPDRPSLTAGGRVDVICDRFEADWKAGRRPRIEDYLFQVDEDERPVLLHELLPLELELRFSAGERPLPREYRERFPGSSEQIETALGVGRATVT